jgi:ABC-type lipoprotein export system ATPase subunit
MPNQPKNKGTAPASTSPAKAQKATQQKLVGLDVVRLKSLQDVSLDFSLSPLTAIMGSNCCGKTTVLHAIACAFRPLRANDPDYQFPLFFRPNSDALWKESDFTVRYSERIGANAHPNLSQNYKKLSDRWTPRYYRRPARYTRFVSIGESVPDIETVNRTSMIHYTKTENVDEIGKLVREVGGQVLNKVYESLYKVTYAYRDKLSIGVKTPTVTYSGLSMSSGEQRVFRILDAVFRAPSYGLILIDEIDLFLHQDALHRMLRKLREHCADKNKQLIFTTHFPPVAEMYKEICIYTLNKVPAKTIVWRGYSYEAMRHITGTQERPICCYVEDDVAEQIVARVATQVGIRRFVEFGSYGPAVNAFNICAGLYLSKQSLKNTLAVLDGDVYGSRPERRNRVNSAFTGDQPIHTKQRKELMGLVRTLTPMKGAAGQFLSPEQVLHRMLHGIDRALVPVDRVELHGIALSVVNCPERHGFVNEIISHTGESRQVALSKIVEIASLSPDWNRYTRVVRKWLAKQKADLTL